MVTETRVSLDLGLGSVVSFSPLCIFLHFLFFIKYTLFFLLATFFFLTPLRLGVCVGGGRVWRGLVLVTSGTDGRAD